VEELLLLAALLLLGAFVVVIAVPFAWWRQSKRLNDFQDRLLRLEGKFEDLFLRGRVVPAQKAAPSKKAAPAKIVPEVKSPLPSAAEAKSVPGVGTHVEPRAPPEPATPPPTPEPTAPVTRPAPPVSEPAPAVPRPAPPAPKPASATAPPPAVTPTATESPWEQPALAAVDADWERRLGTQWLNVLGIIVLVIGIVLFVGYSLRYMGPLGRVATGFGIGALLLGSGWLLERKETYRNIGRALIGGGWAIAYFTAYAAHNLPVARVIESPSWGLALLGAVALGMIGHSFRYRSERITGLAYGLAFFAIVISPVSDTSLIATGLLGVSLVAVLRVMPWYYLGTCGVFATYVCFALWYELRVAAGAALAEPNFLLGIGMLVFYWVAFAIAQFLRMPKTANERASLTVLAGVNCAGFLGLSAVFVQETHTDEMYILTSLSAIAFAGLSWMLRRARLRGPFLIHALAAVVLVVVSVPLLFREMGIDYDWLALPWAVVAAVVLVLGLKLHELWIRVASYLLSGVVVVAIFAINIFGALPDNQLVVWLTMPPIIAFFFVVFEVLKARAGRGDVLDQARGVALAFGYLATALLAALIWEAAHARLVGVLWVAAGALLLEAGWRAGRPHVRMQGLLLAGAGLAGLLLVNLYEVLESDALQAPRWILVTAAAVVYYGVYLRTRTPPAGPASLAAEPAFLQGAAYAATALLALLIWFELDSVSVALWWGLLGLALFELGGLLRDHALRLSGHAMVTAAFLRLFAANFTALGVADALSHRLLSVAPVVAILCYLYFALRKERGSDAWTHPADPVMRVAYTYASVIALVVLLRFELGRDATVLAWAPLALGLLVFGRLAQDQHLRLQAYVLALLSFQRSWATNLTLAGSFLGLPERIVTTGAVIAIFILAAGLTLKWSRRGIVLPASGVIGRLDVWAHQLFGLLAAALFAVMLAYEIEQQWLTVAWAIEAFVVLGVGFVVVERSYRMFGLALLLVCLLKLVVLDLQGVETIYRIFTFIVLGAFLLVVSLIYTRYQHVVRRYL
jgi:uncharacterized membrane protein